MSLKNLSGVVLGPVLLGLLVTSIVVACSDEEEKKEAAAKAETAAQDSFTSDYCTIVLDCCNRVLSLPKDVPTCQKRIAALDPMMLKDEAARGACLAQLRKAAPATDFCPEFGNLEQPACPDGHRKPLTGTKKPGETCAADAECAPAFDGVVACKTVCQVTKRGKEGEGPCVATVEGDIERRLDGEASGAEAFVCFLRDQVLCDPVGKKCTKPVALGAACTDSGSCETTAYCDDKQKCAPRRANGSSCKEPTGKECQGQCVDGFCAAVSDEAGPCSGDALCATGLVCTGGKCAKPPPDARLAASCVAAN